MVVLLVLLVVSVAGLARGGLIHNPHDSTARASDAHMRPGVRPSLIDKTIEPRHLNRVKKYESATPIPLAPHRPLNLFQRLHDLCLVLAFEIQGQAIVFDHSRQLGHCLFRILFSGSGQSLGQQLFHAVPIKDYSGGYYLIRVRPVCAVLFSCAAGVESYRGVYLHSGSRGLYVYSKKLNGSQPGVKTQRTPCGAFAFILRRGR
jgi:hypothetical protein